MHPDLTPLQRIEELDELLSESETRPLVIFKHSYTCGISAEALDELIEHLNRAPLANRKAASEARYAVVTVQTHREVSNAVVTRLGVRHETPQALVVRDGRVVWAGSHFKVTAVAVQAALRVAAQ